MFLILYFTVALVVMYIEAITTYAAKNKFDLLSELVFSTLWVITLPLAIYSVWKDQQKVTK